MGMYRDAKEDRATVYLSGYWNKIEPCGNAIICRAIICLSGYWNYDKRNEQLTQDEATHLFEWLLEHLLGKLAGDA